jgi:hypothetical protein
MTLVEGPLNNLKQVRKTPSWPRSWANSSLLCLCSTGMRGPTCIFWANLTPCSPQSTVQFHAPRKFYDRRMLQDQPLPQQQQEQDKGPLAEFTPGLSYSHRILPYNPHTNLHIIRAEALRQRKRAAAKAANAGPGGPARLAW